MKPRTPRWIECSTRITSRKTARKVGGALLFLFAFSASAENLNLACEFKNGYAVNLEVNESRNEVRVNGLSAVNVIMGKNLIFFDREINGRVWRHQLNRLTGKLLAQDLSSEASTSQLTCKVVAPEF